MVKPSVREPAHGSLEGRIRKRIHDGAKGLRFSLVFQIEQCCFQRGSSKNLQVAPADFRM